MIVNPHINEAIYKMGGPTQVSFKLQISASAVQKWMRRGFIPRLDKAEQVAQASGIEVSKLRPEFHQKYQL